MAGRMVMHGHDVDRQFEHFRAKKVEVSTSTALPRELDGDMIAPSSSLVVNVLPKALRVRTAVAAPTTARPS